METMSCLLFAVLIVGTVHATPINEAGNGISCDRAGNRYTISSGPCDCFHQEDISNGNNGYHCCPSGLVFDINVCVCNWPWAVTMCPTNLVQHTAPGCPEPCSATGPDCKKADIVFVVDGSGSIQKKHWPSMKDFLNSIINRLPISVDASHVGALQFSHKIEKEFFLTADRNAALQGVQNMIYQSGSFTKIAEALKYAREVMFDPNNGARDPATGVKRLFFVITDGMQNPVNTAELTLQVQKNQAAGFITYAIAIGDLISQTELELIATDPDAKYIHKVDNFPELEALGMEFECN